MDSDIITTRITSFDLSELFKDQYFEVLGLDLPNIVRVEPVPLKLLEYEQLHIKSLFRLSDGSYAILDIANEYGDQNIIRYMNYISSIASAVYKNTHELPKLNMITIYSADVNRSETKTSFDLGGLKLSIHEAFLRDLDVDRTISSCLYKISTDKDLTHQEMLKLILCPLTVPGHYARYGLYDTIKTIVDKIQDPICKQYMLIGMKDYVIL